MNNELPKELLAEGGEKQYHTQLGISATADFDENTWTFQMFDDFKVRAGEFYIVEKPSYEALSQRIAELEAAMQTFVDRVDKGEVRSTKTYNQFKELLSSIPSSTKLEGGKEQ